jgi:RNA polymerase sigma factor (sigma-70 family)
MDEGILERLARARGGDQQAWHSLHRSLQPFLLRQAQRFMGLGWAERSVSDLMQDTWLCAMTKIDQFAGGPDDRQTAALLRAWLKKIMRNLHANMVRYDAALIRSPQAPIASLHGKAFEDSASALAPNIPSADLTASKHLSQTEDQARIRSALAKLPDLERDIIRLHVMENVPMPEIAQRMNITFEKVRYHKNVGLRLLGEELGGLSEE